MEDLQKLRKFQLWRKSYYRLAIRIGKLIIFYSFFYMVLAAFWAGYMWIVYTNRFNNTKPYFQLEDSLIGTTPGTSVKPILGKARRLVIDTNSPDDKVDQMINTLKPYFVSLNPANNPHVENCTDDAYASQEDNFCYFDISSLPTECTAEQQFGFARGRPCIMLRLNRIFAWKPEPYDSTDLKSSNLPSVVRENYSSRNNGSQLIYLTCEGQSKEDVEWLGPKIAYYPNQGVEFRYFPFLKQAAYLAPFVFVHFERPKENVNINVHCRWWARNIAHETDIAHDGLQFRLRINRE